MDFNEKLQELRKSKGLTQEELAEALYVSRTAVSKWESGRGYPSIDSLKEISSFFSVSIDALLSADKVVSIGERESGTRLRGLCHRLFAVTDLLSFILIALPLYPKSVDSFVYSVNLFEYTESAGANRAAHLCLFVALMLTGAAKLVLVQLGKVRAVKAATLCSLVLGIVGVLCPALAREAYAVTVAFLLLAVKVALLFKITETGRAAY